MKSSRRDLAAIIENLRSGEAGAFRTLVREMSPVMLNRAAAIVKDSGSAQDVLQQAFLRVFVNRDRLPTNDAGIRGYCYRVMVNLALDHIRNFKLRQRREAEAGLARRAIAGTDSDPEYQALASEAWDMAMSLPAPIRDVIMLRFGCGMTIRETAEALEVPEGTVATRQRSGLEQLRESIQQASLVPISVSIIGLIGVERLAILMTANSATLADALPAGALNAIEKAVMGSIAAPTTGASVSVGAALFFGMVILAGALGFGSPTTGANPFVPSSPVASAAASAGAISTATPKPSPSVTVTESARNSPRMVWAKVNPLAAFGMELPDSFPVPATAEWPFGAVSSTASTMPRPDASTAGNVTAKPLAEGGTAAPTGLVGRVVDSSGRPVAGLSVAIRGDWRAHPTAEPSAVDGGVPMEFRGAGSDGNGMATVTDQFGRYEFAGLDVGTSYDLLVAESAAFLGTSCRAPTVREGEWVPVGDLVVWRPGAITGTVRDATGQVIAGAVVRVVASNVATGQGTRSAGASWRIDGAEMSRLDWPRDDAITDAAGQFFIDGLPPGPVTLAVEMGGFLRHELPGIVVAEGQINGPVAVALDPALLVTVCVQDTTGDPIAGAKVHVQVGTAGDRLRAAASGWASVTNAHGAATIANIAMPLITLEVRAAGFAPYEARIALAVRMENVVPVVLVRCGQIEGRIVNRQTGAGVAGASVELFQSSNGAISGIGAPLTTDSRGRFAIAGLAPGNYEILIFADSFAARWIGPRGLVVGGTLDFGDCLIDREATMAVTTTDSAGHALANVTVRVVPAERTRRQLGAGQVVVGNTDSTGYLRLDGIWADRVDVIATADGYVTTVTRDVPIAFTRANRAELVLHRAGVVEGCARDATGVPLSMEAVFLLGTNPAAPAKVYADKDGRFRFDDVLPGRYALMVRYVVGTNYSFLPLRWFRVSEGDRVYWDVFELSARLLIGSIFDTDGQAMGACRVSCGKPEFDTAGEWRIPAPAATTTADAAGQFCFDQTALGDSSAIEILDPHKRRYIYKLTGNSGTQATTARTFVLPSLASQFPGRIVGRVMPAGTGHSVKGVRVIVASETVEEHWPMSAREFLTDSQGEFSAADLPPGRYHIDVVGTVDFAGETRVVEIDAESPHANVPIRLYPPGHLLLQPMFEASATAPAVPVRVTILLDPLGSPTGHFEVTATVGELLRLNRLRRNVPYRVTISGNGVESVSLIVWGEPVPGDPKVVRLSPTPPPK